MVVFGLLFLIVAWIATGAFWKALGLLVLAHLWFGD